MAFLQKNTTAPVQRSPREVAEQKYRAARQNLWIVILATAVNMVLALLQTGRYFLFSARVPYLCTDYGMFLSGRYPAEYYEGWRDPASLPSGVFYELLAIALVIVALYVVCAIFAPKNNGWMICALVLFVLDTVAMFGDFWLNEYFEASCILDVIFHIWVLVSLISGVSAGAKLKRLRSGQDTIGVIPSAASVPENPYIPQETASTESQGDTNWIQKERIQEERKAMDDRPEEER